MPQPAADDDDDESSEREANHVCVCIDMQKYSWDEIHENDCLCPIICINYEKILICFLYRYYKKVIKYLDIYRYSLVFYTISPESNHKT